MDEMNESLFEDLDLPREAAVELVDWARAAGVSVEELRQALLGSPGAQAR